MKLFRSRRKRTLKALQHQVAAQSHQIAELREVLERSMMLSAKILDQMPVERSTLASNGYRVSSQFDDDGILAYLSSFVPQDRRHFVEFGVENYTESNTRLLLKKDHWTGLVLDGSEQNIEQIRASDEAWRYGLDAHSAFITAENINDLIRSSTSTYPAIDRQPMPIGLLSVDIDGNDYWVWNAIDCVDPLIVVCEYNALFGAEAAVTVPYDPHFVRQEAHYSHLYFGSSLAALVELAQSKGLRFIGCNSAGNNAYFVHRSFQIPLPTLSSVDGFVASRFREGRDESGRLTLKPLTQWLPTLAHLPLVDVREDKRIQVGDLISGVNQSKAA